VWDTGTSLNWVTTNGIERVFYNGDGVTFNTWAPVHPRSPRVAVTRGGDGECHRIHLDRRGGLGGTMMLTKSGTGTLNAGEQWLQS